MEKLKATNIESGPGADAPLPPHAYDPRAHERELLDTIDARLESLMRARRESAPLDAWYLGRIVGAMDIADDHARNGDYARAFNILVEALRRLVLSLPLEEKEGS